jgi:hypothetical protein
MNASPSRISAAIALAVACSASAHAEYRCDPAPTVFDRQACAAAAQSPEALRRFIESMDSIRVNLQFSDYVDERTVQRWESQQRALAEQKDSSESAQKVAANTTR